MHLHATYCVLSEIETIIFEVCYLWIFFLLFLIYQLSISNCSLFTSRKLPKSARDGKEKKNLTPNSTPNNTANNNNNTNNSNNNAQQGALVNNPSTSGGKEWKEARNEKVCAL
jgi:hypothetical protein